MSRQGHPRPSHPSPQRASNGRGMVSLEAEPTTSKQCTKCGHLKPMTSFYKHTRGGYRTVCKACTCRRMRAHRLTPRGRAVETRAAAKRCRAPYNRTAPKRKATNRICDAVARGKIARPKVCSRCKREGPTEGHHADYSQPMKVEWLCRACHSKEHWKHE